MIQFFIASRGFYFFYNTELGWTNNQTCYTSFSDVYSLAFLTANEYVDGSLLLFNLHISNNLTIDEAIPNRQLIFECSYSDLPQLPQTHPEFFI